MLDRAAGKRVPLTARSPEAFCVRRSQRANGHLLRCRWARRHTSPDRAHGLRKRLKRATLHVLPNALQRARPLAAACQKSFGSLLLIFSLRACFQALKDLFTQARKD